MNIFDIIDYTREEILDDTLEPYKWENAKLIRHLNRAYDELCRETRCLIDSTTAAVCQINLRSNIGEYALNSKIIYVLDMRRQSDGQYLLPKNESYMKYLVVNWRSVTGTPFFRVMDTASRIFTTYPKYDSIGYVAGSSDITFVASGSKIQKAGATFTSHFSIGDTLVVTGTTLNNGTLTLSNVANTELTVAEALVNESGTSAILSKVRDVALLRVARLPLVPWTLAELEGATPPSPEIDETYHLGLSDGIGKFAFRKQDTETYDPDKAKFHEDRFEQFKSDVRWDMAQLMEGDTMCTPHFGTL